MNRRLVFTRLRLLLGSALLLAGAAIIVTEALARFAPL